jgi:hypothetical protein
MAGSEGSARHGPERVCHVIGPCADRWGSDFAFRRLFAAFDLGDEQNHCPCAADIDVIPISAVKRVPRDVARFRAARSSGAAAFLSTLACRPASQAACNRNLFGANLEDWRRLLRNQAKLRVKFQWLGGEFRHSPQSLATPLRLAAIEEQHDPMFTG